MIFALFLPLVEGPIDLSRFFTCFTKDEFYNYSNKWVASNHCRLIKKTVVKPHTIASVCAVVYNG